MAWFLFDQYIDTVMRVGSLSLSISLWRVDNILWLCRWGWHWRHKDLSVHWLSVRVWGRVYEAHLQGNARTQQTASQDILVSKRRNDYKWNEWISGKGWTYFLTYVYFPLLHTSVPCLPGPQFIKFTCSSSYKTTAISSSPRQPILCIWQTCAVGRSGTTETTMRRRHLFTCTRHNNTGSSIEKSGG